MHDAALRAGWTDEMRPSLRRSLTLYRHRYGIASAQAEGGDAAMHVAADHFVDQGDEDAGPARADGMTNSHCAAVDVDLVGIQAELAHDTEGLNRESLIQFIEVDIFILPAGFLPNLANCPDRSHHDPFGFDAVGGLRDDADHGLGAQFFRTLRAGDDNRGGSIVDAGSVAGSHGAIFLEGRFQTAEDFDGGVFARAFVFVEDDRRRTFFLSGNFYGHDLRFEAALFDRGDGFAVGVDGELVLLLASDAVLFGDVLAGDPHVVVVVDIPEAVVDHGVDDLRVTETVSLARLREKIGSVGHGFHAAGHDDGTVSGLHRLRGESDRFQSRAADLVDCHGTCRGRESSEDCGLARGILAESGGDDVAHDALVDLRGIDAGALDGFAHHDGSELRSPEIGEASLEFSNWSAAAGDDDDIVKRGHEIGLLRRISLLSL